MNNRKGVNVAELSPQLRRKLGIRESAPVSPRIIALGNILSELQGLTRKDALWALRSAIRQLGGK